MSNCASFLSMFSMLLLMYRHTFLQIHGRRRERGDMEGSHAAGIHLPDQIGRRVHNHICIRQWQMALAGVTVLHEPLSCRVVDTLMQTRMDLLWDDPHFAIRCSFPVFLHPFLSLSVYLILQHFCTPSSLVLVWRPLFHSFCLPAWCLFHGWLSLLQHHSLI